MKRLALSLAILPLFAAGAHAHATKPGSTYSDEQQIAVRYDGTKEQGRVSRIAMSGFIESVNQLGITKGLRVKGGAKGILSVGKNGINVRVVDDDGKTFTARVQTQLFHNVGNVPQSAMWQFTDATEIEIQK